jgi:hypothetical protein
MFPRFIVRLAGIAAIGIAFATAGCSGGSGVSAGPGDGAVDSSADVPADDGTVAGGCGPGTMFCNSACGICVLVGGPCRIDTCGNDGNGGEVCGGGPRCGDGTQCVNATCVPR